MQPMCRSPEDRPYHSPQSGMVDPRDRERSGSSTLPLCGACHQSACKPRIARAFVRCGHVIRNVLFEHESLLWVDHEPLLRARQHVNYEARIADRVDVVDQGHGCGRADPLDFGPQLACGRVGPSFFVRLADQQDARDGGPPLFEQGAREADVLSCVPGPRLDEDGIARHPQFHRPLPIVLSLATWHTVARGAAGGPGEDDQRHHAPVLEIGGCVRDSEVMAAESDRDRAWAQVVPHLLEVP